MSLASLAFPLLRCMDPEAAHKLTLWALAHNLGPRHVPSPPHSGGYLLGKAVPNKVGIPGGFVKDANPWVLRSLFKWGVGFVEVGTITPNRRYGNLEPRHWRVGPFGAINYYGLNSPGLEASAANLATFRAIPSGAKAMLLASLANPASPGEPAPLASNLGGMVRRLNGLVDGYTLNRGCPNTGEVIDDTMEIMKKELGAVFAGNPNVPVLVKFGPFLGQRQSEELQRLVEMAWAMGVRGFIATNTLTHDQAEQHHLLSAEVLAAWPQRHNTNGKLQPVGGYSGPALLPIASGMLAAIRQVAPESTTFAVGGIQGRHHAQHLRYEARADAIMAFTGFALKGPRLLAELLAA